MPPKKKKKEKPIVITEIDPPKVDTFEAQEAEIFQKIGNYLPYRNDQHSGYMQNFIAQFGIKPDHHVLDVGCGIGKNAAYLCDEGINVYGVDITNTLNQDMYSHQNENTDTHQYYRNKFHFTQDVCWLMRPDPVDFVVCTFLLENLPFIKIEPTLYLIDKVMKKGGFFAISTELEPHGPKHLNKQLHRTIQTGRYWADILNKHWRISWEQSAIDNCFFAYTHPRKEKNPHEWPTGY